MSDERSYPRYPLIGVGAIIWQSGKVLLARRAKPPRIGQWSIPGGLLELGETVDAAIRREVMEEVGLELGPLTPVATVDLIERDEAGLVRQHYVLIDATAEATSPAFEVGPEEVLEAAWFAPELIDELGLWQQTVEVIRRAQQLRAALLAGQTDPRMR